MFAFNEGLDHLILKPVSKTYNKVLPSQLRQGVSNAFSNLGEIPSIPGNLFQGNFRGMGISLGRFAFNSTFGLAGFIDVAKHFGLDEHQTDFGVTFARWGDRKSPFLVLPFLGPTTIRDFSGFLIDFTVFSPFTYIKNNAIRFSTTGVWVVNRRASILDLEKITDEFTTDPYALQRDDFLQYRDNRIRRAYGEEAIDTYVGDEEDDKSDNANVKDKNKDKKEDSSTPVNKSLAPLSRSRERNQRG